MEKLMKPAEYAKEFGISRQAVYAKIKRKILSTKNVEGKLYIVMRKDETSSKQHNENPTPASHPSKTPPSKESYKSMAQYHELLKAKDETICVLKETVNDLKESNKQISTTLRGEIDLLKEAFYEMRTLYKNQLEDKKVDRETIDVLADTQNEIDEWVGVKKFLKYHDVTKEKHKAKLIKRLTALYHSGDGRLMLAEDKLKVNLSKNFQDILKS